MRFVHSPAVPFSTSPALRKVFTRPAMTSCPSRLECSLCPAFRRLSFSRPRFRWPPESSVPCWCAVTTVCPLGNCDSARTETILALLHSTGSGFSSPLVARVPSFAFPGCARTPPEEPVNPASSRRSLRRRFLRDRTNQPGPIFPRSPGIIHEWLIQTFVSTNRSFFQ